MALQIDKEYNGSLARYEYSRYKNNFFLNSIHRDFVEYMSDVVVKEKNISHVYINFPNFIFKDRYGNLHLDEVFEDRMHITFRGINNELLNCAIFEHDQLLLYVTLIEQCEFYHFIFKYTLNENSLTLVKNIDILENIFEYHKKILSTTRKPIRHLNLDDFEVIDIYQEKEYPNYEKIIVPIDDLFNNFQYHYDLSRAEYRRRRLFRSSSKIFISITRKRLNIFQYNILIEREYYIPLLITSRIDMRKKMPMILNGRSLIYKITDFKKLSHIMPKINDTLRFKIKSILR